MWGCGSCDFTTNEGIEANRHEDSNEGHIVDELSPFDGEPGYPADDEELERENPKDLPP